MEFTIGMQYTLKHRVTEADTASAYGSGFLPVLATPCMVAWMEGASALCVAECLDEGCGTVGTHLDVAHVSATPVGMEVTCEATLTAVERKRLTFAVRAYDEQGLIGEGTHERAVIHVERFMERVQAKGCGN